MCSINRTILLNTWFNRSLVKLFVLKHPILLECRLHIPEFSSSLCTWCKVFHKIQDNHISRCMDLWGKNTNRTISDFGGIKIYFLFVIKNSIFSNLTSKTQKGNDIENSKEYYFEDIIQNEIWANFFLLFHFFIVSVNGIQSNSFNR